MLVRHLEYKIKEKPEYGYISHISNQNLHNKLYEEDKSKTIFEYSKFGIFIYDKKIFLTLDEAKKSVQFDFEKIIKERYKLIMKEFIQ